MAGDAELRAQIQKATSDYDREKLEELVETAQKGDPLGEARKWAMKSSGFMA